MSAITTGSGVSEPKRDDPMGNTPASGITSPHSIDATSQCAANNNASAGTRIGSPMSLHRTATVLTSTSYALYDRNSTSYPLHNEVRENFGSNDVYSTPIAPVSPQLVPPPLSRLLSIPLPSLSPNIPIQTHTLITYHPHFSAISWALSHPPSTARLANVATGSNVEQWLYDVAVAPTTLSSITIRLRDVERPVIVFPFEAGCPIRIVDVLSAVYNAVYAEVIEHQVVTGNVSGYNSLGVWPPRVMEVEDSIAADAIVRHFRNRVWWNGLSPSEGEVDVWVLQLRGGTCGRFLG